MTRSGKDNRFSRSPGGVALVWVSKKGVLPIIASHWCATTTISAGWGASEQLRSLDEVSAIPLGFPHDLFSDAALQNRLTGGKLEQFEHPRPALTNIRNNLRISARVTRQAP